MRKTFSTTGVLGTRTFSRTGEEIKLGQLVEIVADEGVHATAHTPQLAVKVGLPLFSCFRPGRA